MATRVRTDWFTPVLVLIFGMVVFVFVLSGRWGLLAATPVSGEGTQWQLHVRYGLMRAMIVDGDSDTAMQDSGAAIEDMESFRFEWGAHATFEGGVKLIQLPIWFFALALLAWIVLRAARSQMRRATGNCPGCTRVVTDEVYCPKCGYILRRNAVN